MDDDEKKRIENLLDIIGEIAWRITAVLLLVAGTALVLTVLITCIIAIFRMIM